jgi:hypothetical protein
MSKENKCTDAELQQRITQIYELLINAWNRQDILRYVDEQTDWNICESQIDNYITKAKAIIKQNAENTQEEWLNETKNRLSDLYKKNMSLKRYGECRRLLESANKILGYEKLNIDHSGETPSSTIIEILAKQLIKKDDIQKTNR